MDSYLVDGVWPAVTIPFDETLELSVGELVDHCAWLIESGCSGVVVNGSLGEYETLSDEERRGVVEAVVSKVGPDRVIAGVSDKTADKAVLWTEQAQALEILAVMALPPTSHAPTGQEVIAHYEAIGKVGLPVIAYNNPFSTRVDLTPELLGEIADAVPTVVATKDFSQDVRRVLRVRQSAPRLQVIAGCDDVLLESVLVGARGWIAGFANAFPTQSVSLYQHAVAGDIGAALAMYLEMLPAMRWDADPRFVQAVKLAQEVNGRYGGSCRMPRLALSEEDAKQLRKEAERVLSLSTP